MHPAAGLHEGRSRADTIVHIPDARWTPATAVPCAHDSDTATMDCFTGESAQALYTGMLPADQGSALRSKGR